MDLLRTQGEQLPPNIVLNTFYLKKNVYCVRISTGVKKIVTTQACHFDPFGFAQDKLRENSPQCYFYLKSG